jgi:hypothetical protein
MDKVYQVFVSSTYADLKEERQQVSNTLAKAGYMAAGMELFPATDRQQLEYIKRIIDRSDYYVVIVAGRYGSLADDTMSFTEREFEYAKSKGIPILAFLHGDPKQIAVGKTDEDSTQAVRLEGFRTKLKSGRIVEFWLETGDLCNKVLIAVANAANLTPGMGWVRGDQAIDPRVLQEAERLRLENTELRYRLEAIEGNEVTFDESLVGPNDNVEIPLIIVNSKKDPNGRQNTQTQTVIATIGEIFISLYDALLTEPNEAHLRTVIGVTLSRRLSAKAPGADFRVDAEEVIKLRHQLEALDLIEAFGDSTMSTMGPFPTKRDFIAWRPSRKGRRYFIGKKARKRNDPNLL